MAHASTPNPLCALFEIEYPLIMGAITPKPELGAMISEAGGLGCIEGISTPDTLRRQILRMRELTDRPFSVNFPLAFGKPELTEARIEVALEERVPAVITSAGSPKLYTRRLKDRGIRVAHVVAGLAHARKAAEAGVDALIAEPTESGGYRGNNEISMMVLIPCVRRALPDLPLAAAGSVVDRAGMVAVMALGADGVQLGTRLIATKEGGAFFHDGAQKLILAADDTATMSADTPTRPRVSRPELVEAVLGPRGKSMQMGQAAALIDDIPDLAGVFAELFEGAPAHARELAERMARLAPAR